MNTESIKKLQEDFTIKLEIYKAMPFGEMLFKNLGQFHNEMEESIIEIFGDDETYILEDYYKLLKDELEKFYNFLFKEFTERPIPIIKTTKEKLLLKKYHKQKDAEKKKQYGVELAKNISKRLFNNNILMKNKTENFVNYFGEKIAIKLLMFLDELGNEDLRRAFRLQEYIIKKYKNEDYVPNRKYRDDDFDFVINLKEQQGIAFKRGVEKLQEKKGTRKINAESFLRRLSSYYNKKTMYNKNKGSKIFESS